MRKLRVFGKWLPAEQYVCKAIRLQRFPNLVVQSKTIRFSKLPSTALMTANRVGGTLPTDVPEPVALPTTFGTGVALLCTEGDTLRRVVD